MVALGSALARPVGLPADDQVLCPPLHSPQDRSLRSQHHPTHRSGVQLHTLVEAWHKGLTDAVFGHLPQSFPGMCNAARLLAAGRRANTWLGYAGKLKRWEEFCACAGVRQFPAHQSHVLCYLGYLQEEGAVKAGSLQQYLSDFNSWHADMGLSKQAVGQAVNMLCRGYSEVQGDEDDEVVRAWRPIPAYVMCAILTLAHSTPSPSIRRAATASVLCHAFMLRADSCVRLKHRHVSFTTQGLALQLHVKTCWRDISTTVHRPGHDEVYQLLRDWVRMCSDPGQASLWLLPDRQHDTFTSTHIDVHQPVVSSVL